LLLGASPFLNSAASPYTVHHFTEMGFLDKSQPQEHKDSMTCLSFLT